MFSLIDASRLLLAVPIGGIIIALPGAALARLFRFSRTKGAPDNLTGLVVGLATLPLLDSLITREAGLDAALAVTLVLASLGLFYALPQWTAKRISAAWAIAITIGFLLLTIEWIDIDVAGQLFQPFTIIDTVKHAATVQALLDSGAPPRDAFFLRPDHASYYYYFYALAALVVRLSGGLVDARSAFGGTMFWTGLGLFGLVRLAIARAGLERQHDTSRLPVLIVIVMATSGLDILAVLRMGFLQGLWLADPLSWNEQTAGWIESLLWVPHHVTGLIAGMVGLVALTDAMAQGLDRHAEGRAIGLAALCFASALGLSIWLTLALVTTVVLWSVLLVVERRWRTLGLIVVAGALALILASPQIVDLYTGRSPGPSPIIPTIRAFTPIDGLLPEGPWRLIGHLVALPVNYFAGFGALASGTILFWTHRGTARMTDFGKMLVLAAIAGLLLGAFLKSTIFNNDLGWRVVLYPLLAGTIWTVAFLDGLFAANRASGLRRWRTVPAFLMLMLGLGWSTSLYALVSLRAYPLASTEGQFSFMSADPKTERALRVAYLWANDNLPPKAVLQHDPTRPRAFAFGLYGHNPTAVSDTFGALYGADPTSVDARIAALLPIFRFVLPEADVRARAEANGVDDLVVTMSDTVWSRPDAFVWHVKPVYASTRVRIIPVRALAKSANTSVSALDGRQ